MTIYDRALTHAVRWASIVQRQADRVRQAVGPSAIHAHHDDAIVLVIALRNVIRSAKLAQLVCGDPARIEAIERALTHFDDRFPQAVNLRDIIEHFDDYERGIGRLQKKDLDPDWSPLHDAYFARSADMYEIHIGNRSIDVLAAAEEAWLLTHAVAGDEATTEGQAGGKPVADTP